MSMFCYQCQETAKGTGCQVRGVCGKDEEVAKLQDLLIYTLKGISLIVVKEKPDYSALKDLDHEVLKSLFITITNANFDPSAIEAEIKKMIGLRDRLKEISGTKLTDDAVVFQADSRAQMLEKAASIGVLATENEDVRSLREMIKYVS